MFVWRNCNIYSEQQQGDKGQLRAKITVCKTSGQRQSPTEWRIKSPECLLAPLGASCRIPRTLSRTWSPPRCSLPDPPTPPSPVPRSSTAGTSWCRPRTATPLRVVGKVAVPSDTTSTRWTDRGVRRTGSVRWAAAAWALTRLWPACSSACPWPTGGCLCLLVWSHTKPNVWSDTIGFYLTIWLWWIF